MLSLFALEKYKSLCMFCFCAKYIYLCYCVTLGLLCVWPCTHLENATCSLRWPASDQPVTAMVLISVPIDWSCIPAWLRKPLHQTSHHRHSPATETADGWQPCVPCQHTPACCQDWCLGQQQDFSVTQRKCFRTGKHSVLPPCWRSTGQWPLPPLCMSVRLALSRQGALNCSTPSTSSGGSITS